MEPEPEPQESHQSYLNYNLEQQDILLDNIKEYRKIIRNIMDELNNCDNPDCKKLYRVYYYFHSISLFNYDYSYSTLEYVQIEEQSHRNNIEILMSRLNASDDSGCKYIYNKIYHSRLYQYYYLGYIDTIID
tara:strand:- start:1633 stop:2028 length:396 start_codon:yes stop_codon:yes gene_type:complete